MGIYDIELQTLRGEQTSLRPYHGRALLAVNVASKCGLTPQYAGLQRLQERFGERGFDVLGFPCNQFLGQEPGDAEEIDAFCTTNYGVTFPMFSKLEVNGPGRHPLYAVLTEHADADGDAGDVQWNFEKFLISPEGEVLERFRPRTDPEDERITSAIERALSGA